MKRTILALLLLAASALILNAQEIRTNYRSGSKSHISTDYEEITCGECPLWTRVEKVGYSDGSSIYILYLNFEQKVATNVPKGVKMAFNLPNGSMVRADQIGQDSATKKSFTRGNNKVYWNRTKYALDEADMKKISRGISSIDVITGWNPEDYIQMSFPGDELASLFRRHMEAIDKASASTVNLKAELAGRANNRNNILTTAKAISARGENYAFNVTLTHLSYKNSNKQAIDEDDIFTLYPSIRELRLLCGGIKAITIEYEGGKLTDSFSSNALSSAINQQYQLLMSVSDR